MTFPKFAVALLLVQAAIEPVQSGDRHDIVVAAGVWQVIEAKDRCILTLSVPQSREINTVRAEVDPETGHYRYFGFTLRQKPEGGGAQAAYKFGNGPVVTGSILPGPIRNDPDRFHFLGLEDELEAPLMRAPSMIAALPGGELLAIDLRGAIAAKQEVVNCSRRLAGARMVSLPPEQTRLDPALTFSVDQSEAERAAMLAVAGQPIDWSAAETVAVISEEDGPILLNRSEVFTSADYPTLSRMKNEQGTVFPQVTVDAQGNPIDCFVHDDVATPALREITCRLIMERARFEPAKDENGNPKQDVYGAPIRWILPEPEGLADRQARAIRIMIADEQGSSAADGRWSAVPVHYWFSYGVSGRVEACRVDPDGDATRKRPCNIRDYKFAQEMLQAPVQRAKENFTLSLEFRVIELDDFAKINARFKELGPRYYFSSLLTEATNPGVGCYDDAIPRGPERITCLEKLLERLENGFEVVGKDGASKGLLLDAEIVDPADTSIFDASMRR